MKGSGGKYWLVALLANWSLMFVVATALQIPNMSGIAGAFGASLVGATLGFVVLKMTKATSIKWPVVVSLALSIFAIVGNIYSQGSIENAEAAQVYAPH